MIIGPRNDVGAVAHASAAARTFARVSALAEAPENTRLTADWLTPALGCDSRGRHLISKGLASGPAPIDQDRRASNQRRGVAGQKEHCTHDVFDLANPVEFNLGLDPRHLVRIGKGWSRQRRFLRM